MVGRKKEPRREAFLELCQALADGAVLFVLHLFYTTELWEEELKELESKQVHILESLVVLVLVSLIVVAGFFIVVVVVYWFGGLSGSSRCAWRFPCPWLAGVHVLAGVRRAASKNVWKVVFHNHSQKRRRGYEGWMGCG